MDGPSLRARHLGNRACAAAAFILYNACSPSISTFGDAYRAGSALPFNIRLPVCSRLYTFSLLLPFFRCF